MTEKITKAEVKNGLEADNVVLFPGVRLINRVLFMGGRKYNSLDAITHGVSTLPPKEYRRFDKWIIAKKEYNQTRNGERERHKGTG